MTISVNKLTDRAVRGMKTPGYHADGDGLYLQVTLGGSRSWIYRFTVDGRRREMGLGSFQDVNLAEARQARDGAKRGLANGSDPLAGRRARLAKMEGLSPDSGEAVPSRVDGAANAQPTLLECWNDYVRGQEGGWRGRKTKAGWTRSIEKHAAAIKHKPVARIDLDDIIVVLEPLWMTKAESAGKLRERLERVLDYARVRKLRSGENPALWKGNLIHLLPPRPKLQRGHMPAMPYQDVPDFMVKLAASKGMSARALEFTILTVSRETMTLEATWREIGGDIWDLDASRMKERAFRQPLSAGALAVLSKIRPDPTHANALIFPAQKGGVMSNMAMDMLLRDLAPPWTPHGMRSTFRDWAGDETEFAREVIEECLSHAVGDETERAYRRSDALKKRRLVLEAWSGYCLSKLSPPDRFFLRGR